MKRILLVSAACMALTFPATAQNSGTAQPDQNQSQQQGQNQQPQNQNRQSQDQQSQSAGQQQAQTIDPSSLSKSEIRDLQTNLDKQGFDAKGVDGIWGPDTKEAVMQFQQAKKLPGNGELNQQTLSALGVNVENQGQTTGSAGNRNASGHNPSNSEHQPSSNPK